MPWQEVSTMALRQEFVSLVSQEGANMRELCRRYGISPPTGYKWLERYRAQGPAGVEDRSRRPLHSPRRTPPELEAAVLAERALHPAWGGRKLRVRLLTQGFEPVPSASTVSAILDRHGCIDPLEAEKHGPWQRFERDAPNQLWQMDFKGNFALAQGRCYPLTVLDDHSRFNLGLEACADEQEATVRERLTRIFRRYGLPDRMLMDNGSPWGYTSEYPHTALTAWLLRLDIRVSHGRAYHPQTQGKEERFHRTLKAEVLTRPFTDVADCQRAFDPWRDVYNFERPHEALGMAVPASRYQVSWRAFPEQLPPIEYGPGDEVRKVQDHGEIMFRGKEFRVGRAFQGYPVALRPTTQETVWSVYFCRQELGIIDLAQPGMHCQRVNHVSEQV